MEQLDYNLLFRWFTGPEIDDVVWNHALLGKNRDRLLNQSLALAFFERIKTQATGLMSDQHFTWTGRWSRLGQVRRVSRGKTTVRLERTTVATSTATSTAQGHTRVAGRSEGAPVQEIVWPKSQTRLSGPHHGGEPQRSDFGGYGNASRWHSGARCGTLMVAELTNQQRRHITVGADEAHDTQDFVNTLSALRATPPVILGATHRRSAIDGSTTRHTGYASSLSKRWLVVKPFGWLKRIGGLRKVK